VEIFEIGEMREVADSDDFLNLCQISGSRRFQERDTTLKDISWLSINPHQAEGYYATRRL
jgi:hypothetical protein